MEDLLKYKDDPVGFARDILGLELWEAQREIVESIVHHHQVAIADCFAGGMTTALSVAALHHTATKDRSLALFVGPHRQVKQIAWRQIGRLLPRLKDYGPDKTYSGFALGQSCCTTVTNGETNALAGIILSGELLFIEYHVTHREAEWVDLFRSQMGVSSHGCRDVRAGYPQEPGGRLHRCFFPTAEDGYYERHPWRTIHVSALESPNVVANANLVPGLVTHEWVHTQNENWGPDTELWTTKVLGRWPAPQPTF